MIKRLTEHDFFGSAPDEKARILIIVTITGFATNDPAHYPTWFGAARGGTEKWLDPETNELHATQGVARHLAVQIGFAARFDLEELEAVTIRFFVDDEATVGDPFSEDAHVVQVPGTTLQELGFFLVPASRTWDRWISFSSELQDFPVEDHPISRVGDHLNGVTGGAEGDDSYGAPGRAHSLGGASPLHSRHGQVLAEGNGVPGDRESEGSRKQSAGATNRKRPCAIGIERCRDGSPEVSRGHSRQRCRRAEQRSRE